MFFISQSFLQMSTATLAKNNHFIFPNSVMGMQSFVSCIKFENEGESVWWSLLCLHSYLDYYLKRLSFLQCY